MAPSPSRTRRTTPAAAPEEPRIHYVPDDAGEDEAVEGRVVDDASESRQPLDGKNPTRPDRTSKESTRSGRAAMSRPPKQPQDHKQSQESLAAQRREAAEELGLDDTTKVGFEYEGMTFVFDPENINIGFQRRCERGAPVAALELLFGSAVIDQIETWPFEDIQELINRATKAAGLGGS